MINSRTKIGINCKADATALIENGFSIGNIKLGENVILYRDWILQNLNDFRISVELGLNVVYEYKKEIQFAVDVVSGNIFSITALQDYSGSFLGIKPLEIKIQSLLRLDPSIEHFGGYIYTPKYRGVRFGISYSDPRWHEYHELSTSIDAISPDVLIDKIEVFPKFWEGKNNWTLPCDEI